MTTSRVVVCHRAYEELRKSFLEGEELAKVGWMRVGGGWFVLRGGWGMGREVMRNWDGLDGFGELRREVKMEGIQGNGRGGRQEWIVGLERRQGEKS
jgi:hypothetical protein